MSVKSRIGSLALILLLTLSTGVMAQQYMHQGGMRGTMPHPGQGMAAQCPLQVDLANKTALEGTVESVNMAPGQGMPTFVLQVGDKKATIVASPYRILANALFEIRVGDRMNVLAFPSTQTQDTFLAAELKNLTTGKTLLLRDDNGLPAGGVGPRHAAGPRW